jgi:hypothetical protein
MADCNPIITFKGKKYSYAEFASMLHDGLIDANELRDMLDKGTTPKVNEEYKMPENFGKLITEQAKSEQPSERTGIKRSFNDANREAMGLKPVELPKGDKVNEVLQKAKEGVDNDTIQPSDIRKSLLENINNPELIKISQQEAAALLYDNDRYEAAKREANLQVSSAEAKLAKDPENAELQMNAATAKNNQIMLDSFADEYSNAHALVSAYWGKLGHTLQAEIDKGQVVNAIRTIKNLRGEDISPELETKLKDLQKTADDAVAKLQLLEQESRDRAAAEFVNTHNVKVKSSGKVKVSKTKEALQAEREIIKSRIKEKLLAKSGTINATLPLAEQTVKLASIAPDIIQLAKSYVSEGVTKLSDVIDNIRGDFETLSKDDVRDILAGIYNEQSKTRDELTKDFQKIKSEAALRRKIDNTEKGIIEKTKTKGESSEEVKLLQKELAEAKKQAKNEFANVATAELEKQAEQIKKQILKGEFTKEAIKKTEFPENKEWAEAKQALTNVKKELKKELHAAFDSKKTKYMRGLDWVNRWNRRALFFAGYNTLVKLSTSALTSTINKPLEFGVGKLASKAFPKLASRATGEANQNIDSLVKFYTEFFDAKKAAAGTWEIFKTGSSKLDKELSDFYESHHIPLVDIFTDMHAVLKDPLKRAQFEMNFATELKNLQSTGVDYTSPLLIEAARQRAFNAAKYEILMGKTYKSVADYFAKLENQAIESGQSESSLEKAKGNLQYTGASLYKLLVPVAGVPYNLVRLALSPLRLPLNLAKALNTESSKKAFETMPQETANEIFRELKKGSVGTAYWILGAYLASQGAAGGLFTKFNEDKKRRGKVKSGELEISGEHIPHSFQHSWNATALQGGATFRLLLDKASTIPESKKDITNIPLIYATLGTGGAYANQLPVYKRVMEIGGALSTPSGAKYLGKGLKRQFTFEAQKKNLNEMVKETKDAFGLDTTTKQ